MVSNGWIGRDLEGSDRGLNEALSSHYLGGGLRNTMRPQSG
jgi:hypothetical protein